MIKSTMLVLAALALSACSSVPKPIQVDVKPVERPALIVPKVDQFTSRNVKWVVITPENVESVFADLKSANKNVVVFAITADGYENLSLNIADITKLIQQQRSIIAAYQQYYETEP
jgi:hypothetical protein